MSELRVGIGIDAHAFAGGVPLVLGGVAIDHPRGLAGHSDGDVIAHALIDALLGAAGLGDIGSLFLRATSAGRAPTRSTCLPAPTARCVVPAGRWSTPIAFSSARSRGSQPGARRCRSV